jgi:excisionase family DNA binding protein
MENNDETSLVSAGLLTVAKAAEFLSLSRSKIYQLMDAGTLVYCKIDGARRIPRASVLKLASESLSGRAQNADPAHAGSEGGAP